MVTSSIGVLISHVLPSVTSPRSVISCHGVSGLPATTIAKNNIVCPGHRMSLVVMVLAVVPSAPWQLMMLIQSKLCLMLMASC